MVGNREYGKDSVRNTRRGRWVVQKWCGVEWVKGLKPNGEGRLHNTVKIWDRIEWAEGSSIDVKAGAVYRCGPIDDSRVGARSM